MDLENIANTNERKPMSIRPLIAVTILLSILFSSFFGAIFGFMGAKISGSFFSTINNRLGNILPKQNNQNTAPNKQLLEEDSAVISVVDKSSPAVVAIIISKDVPKYRSFFQDPFGFFSNPAPSQGGGTQRQTVGKGSGFLISASGMILTNKHVVEDQTADYTVITNDGKEYPAKVLARDSSRDMSVIKIEGNDFSTLEFGDSDTLKIGQTVIAIGNSLGEFYNTVSKGIVSGLGRNITAGSGFGQTEQLTNIIQTDAAINPGNSGGPLLDVSGNVIGVNVAMAQGAENIGFALPINQVKKIINQVKSTGKISVPFLGIRYVMINKEIQKDNSLPFDYGALVLRGEKGTDLAVMPGSTADKAGIAENDIILEISGQKLTEENQLADVIAKYNVGDTVTLKFWHKGETKEARVTLEERK